MQAKYIKKKKKKNNKLPKSPRSIILEVYEKS
jgi:hypothetical protein